MKTNIINYRGGVTLGLLAISLFNLSPRLLAEEAQGEEKLNRWEKRFDVNQDGKLDTQETAAKEKARKDAFKRLQGKYDKDGDGKLSETEKAARRTDMEALVLRERRARLRAEAERSRERSRKAKRSRLTKREMAESKRRRAAIKIGRGKWKAHLD